ncbi:Transcription factor [Penicillium griseofulvum]|uniref:Transcription factor n=1 Tax=Penicillium patulum TaxID=5078 RepID=A0A135LKN0_PENPA|nr:Transcription factor [Penicillium griseofulvum]KXG49499.1 Transcription factor [Penicillium griseofulvum]
MFFKYAEINSFYMERKWIEEKVAICYSSTTTYSAIDFPWVCCVLVVLAIGTQVAHMEDGKLEPTSEITEELNLCSEDSVGLIFYHAACKLIPDVLLVASQESVQVFLLLATYSLPVSTGGLAYTYYGLAMKMAIQNGMHRKYQGGNCDPRIIEIRNRLFWTTYTVEKYDIQVAS